MSLKGFLKRILPPPVNSFNREIARVLDAIEADKKILFAQQESSENRLRSENTALLKLLETMRAEQNNRLDILEESLQKQSQMIGEHAKQIMADDARYFSEMQKECAKIAENVERTRRQSIDASRHAAEAVWAQIFNNTITNSTWLRDKTFSPGRWAVGYPYLYTMYRALNEMHPKRILELGLGQSTRMIAQYAAAFQDVEHIVVEHDQNWIDFFCNDFPIPRNTSVVLLDREMISYKNAESVRVFKGFRETFQDQKFDFISVDAPLGGDMKQYARIDVLNLIPSGLSENFIITVDDCNRVGENNTVKEIQQSLTEHQIDYRVGWYSGEKSSVLICPSHMGFLCSM